MTEYSRSGPFLNGNLPAVNDDALNNMDEGIDLAHEEIEALATLVATKIGLPASPVVGDLLQWDGSAWVAEALPASIGVPTGTILDYDGDTAPTGFLMLTESVQLVSRTTYADLFGVVGERHSPGDGSTTFGLPATGGRTMVGRSGTDTDFDTVGDTFGAKTHTLSAAEMPVHTHSVTDPGHTHTVTVVTAVDTADNSAWYTPSQGGTTAPVTASATTGISLGNAGSGSAHNNVQPSLVVNKIIKT